VLKRRQSREIERRRALQGLRHRRHGPDAPGISEPA